MLWYHQIIMGYFDYILWHSERRGKFYGRFICLQGEYCLKLLTEAQIVGLIRVAESNGGACNSSDGTNMVFRV
jgi:hypothetical protein